jgi:hypothetical protein
MKTAILYHKLACRQLSPERAVIGFWCVFFSSNDHCNPYRALYSEFCGHPLMEIPYLGFSVPLLLRPPFADKRIISFAFRSDDPGQAALGEPVVEAVNLPPLRERIVQQTQKRIDRIEHDSSGSSRVGLGLDSSEHSTQVEFAGLDHVRLHLGIKKEELLADSRWPVHFAPAESP